MAEGISINPMPNIDNSVPPPAQIDMFGRMEKMANIRTLMNQNAIFQQTFDAKQRAGEIMANSPDIATGLQRLQKDPVTASFAPELMNTYRQLDLTNMQVQSGQQSMYSSGFHSIMKALPSAYTDMPSFNRALDAQFKTLPPMTQDYIKNSGAIDSLRSALFDDLPTQPGKRADGSPMSLEETVNSAYKRRWNALMLGADFTPDAINAITGKPIIQDVGGRLQPGTQAPSIFGGGVTSAPGAIDKTLAPTVANAGGVPIVLDQGAGAAPGPGNMLGANAPGTQPGPVGPGAQPAQKAPLAGTGRPLWNSEDDLTAPGITTLPSRMNPTGMPILSPAQTEVSNDLSKEYGGSGAHGYDNANTALATLQYMDADYDQLAHSKNKWLTPGFAGKARVSMANLANTVTQMVQARNPNAKIDLPVPIKDVAAAESFIKNTRYLGLQVLTTMLGNQREAAQTIQNITEAVPSIDNTFLGGKVLVDTIRAQSQRVVDERNFDNAWLAKNKTLLGAREKFNQLQPPELYAQTVLDKYGLSSSGFKSPQAVLQLVRQGYLEKDDAKRILDKQFPGGPARHMPAPPPVAPATSNALVPGGTP